MIKIYGHSDDCFELEGMFTGEHEFNCYDQAVTVEIVDQDKGVVVTGEYARKNRAGVWSITVEPLEEDKAMPPMHLNTYSNGYSPLLVIECSPNATVKEIRRDPQ